MEISELPHLADAVCPEFHRRVRVLPLILSLFRSDLLPLFSLCLSTSLNLMPLLSCIALRDRNVDDGVLPNLAIRDGLHQGSNVEELCSRSFCTGRCCDKYDLLVFNIVQEIRVDVGDTNELEWRLSSES
jgi:hypothetical protein